MSPEEHYRAAEYWLAKAGAEGFSSSTVANYIGIANVHAVLATADRKVFVSSTNLPIVD